MVKTRGWSSGLGRRGEENGFGHTEDEGRKERRIKKEQEHNKARKKTKTKQEKKQSNNILKLSHIVVTYILHQMSPCLHTHN